MKNMFLLLFVGAIVILSGCISQTKDNQTSEPIINTTEEVPIEVIEENTTEDEMDDNMTTTSIKVEDMMNMSLGGYTIYFVNRCKDEFIKTTCRETSDGEECSYAPCGGFTYFNNDIWLVIYSSSMPWKVNTPETIEKFCRHEYFHNYYGSGYDEIFIWGKADSDAPSVICDSLMREILVN